VASFGGLPEKKLDDFTLFVSMLMSFHGYELFFSPRYFVFTTDL